MTEKRERVYINSENKATFICPVCKKTRNADVSKILSFKTAINIRCKCKCGHSFLTSIERRKFFRKDIVLKGTCFLGMDNLELDVIITDISRSGLKIELKNPRVFQPDDEMLIEFNIDDSERSLISKKIIVRSVSGKKIGAEFKSPEHYDKLGYYLMFH